MLKTRFLLITSCMLGVLSSVGNDVAKITDEKPIAYMVADAHLDTQWNWDVQTTIRDYVWNTINRNLLLMEKYPEYIFNFEGGIKYAWMKEYYPREYEILNQRIRDGRWHISGASWDATDAIVPSIESAIRNILLGQTYYREEFGVESTDIFLPDCFGFGYTLPTVASHCGLIGFSSQKLQWRNNPFYGDKKIPFTLGLWQGVDGARIMMAHGFDYTTRWGDEDLTASKKLADRISQSPLNMVYHYYGTGDVGGAPTQTSVDAVIRAAGKVGDIKVVSATSDRLYKDFMPYASHPELPIYEGELTMDVHGTGCYTSQAAMKLYNRQNELLGDAAERAAVAAELTAGKPYPIKMLRETWQRFVFHQFHDDLTGTSIPRAYEFSWNDELISLKQFSEILLSSSGAIASKMDTRVSGIPVVIYNALGRDIKDIVEIKLPSKYRPEKVVVKDASGQECGAQIVDYRDGEVNIIAEVKVPSNGYAVFDVKISGKGKGSVIQNADGIENSVYKISFDQKGDIVSLIDKKADKELVADGKAIRLALFEENKSYSWPAWEILKSTIDKEPVSIVDNVKISMVETGPIRYTMCVEKEYKESKFRQYIRLYEGELAERIDFYNEVEWSTSNALLKAEFPLTVSNIRATYDLGVGSIERGNNTATSYEVYAHRWADITDQSGDYGVTIMNDCKYGWDKPNDNTLRLTLLHTPETDNNFVYQNRQDFGHHEFTYCIYPHNSALDKSLSSCRADVLNQRLKAFVTEKHSGELGKWCSLCHSDNPNISIKAIKRAEMTDEYVIRVYETSGDGYQNGKLEFLYPIKEAVVADGTEKAIETASFEGNFLNVEIGSNGIGTYKVRFEHSGCERSDDFKMLGLKYDKRCFSMNAFESEADFSEGYSYAAELLPDTVIDASGVLFKIEKDALMNGKECHGDTIYMPNDKGGRLYILASAAKECGVARGEFVVGKEMKQISVPSYSEFIGQWGHDGHTRGYLKEDEIAYIGTHRHAADGDCHYEFTYMFKYTIDVPEGVNYIILPDDPEIVIFAATFTNKEPMKFESAYKMFRTAIVGDGIGTDIEASKSRMTKVTVENMIACSGYVNEKEGPALLHDGDVSTKWCDTSGIPSYVDYDLGTQQEISGWTLTSAGVENPEYITSSCLLQTKDNIDEEWRTVDAMFANKKNVVKRMLKAPVKGRYVRLLVVQPEQSEMGNATRIYEFSVF